jgi:hypothetical protein
MYACSRFQLIVGSCITKACLLASTATQRCCCTLLQLTSTNWITACLAPLLLLLLRLLLVLHLLIILQRIYTKSSDSNINCSCVFTFFKVCIACCN